MIRFSRFSSYFLKSVFVCLFLVLGNPDECLNSGCTSYLYPDPCGSRVRVSAFLKVPPSCTPLVESMRAGLCVISERQTNTFSAVEEHRSKNHKCLNSKTVWLWGLGSVAERFQSPGS